MNNLQQSLRNKHGNLMQLVGGGHPNSGHIYLREGAGCERLALCSHVRPCFAGRFAINSQVMGHRPCAQICPPHQILSPGCWLDWILAQMDPNGWILKLNLIFSHLEGIMISNWLPPANWHRYACRIFPNGKYSANSCWGLETFHLKTRSSTCWISFSE